MKTLVLEIEDDAYQQVMSFISLVPKCHILDFDDDVSSDEMAIIEKSHQDIERGNYSEFVEFVS
ncbi:MAG: hypothetical protein WCL34_12670 [Methylococcaceae bacterium]